MTTDTGLLAYLQECLPGWYLTLERDGSLQETALYGAESVEAVRAWDRLRAGQRMDSRAWRDHQRAVRLLTPVERVLYDWLMRRSARRDGESE